MTEDAEHGRSRKPGAMDRRAALTALGGAGLGAAGIVALGRASASASTTPGKTGSQPKCVLTPEVTEGPYYLDYELFRRDITEGKDGVPLILRATVVNSTTCEPIPRAALDIWHCDALGEYSGYTALGVGGANGGKGGGKSAAANPSASPTGSPSAGGGGHSKPSDSLTFLRGVQLTDRHGVVEFRTIYPGWYLGRAIHIHSKVHIGGKVVHKKYTGGHVSHTGQFFFDEAVTKEIIKLRPYATNTVTRTTLDEDGIYKSGGSSGLLTLRPLHKGSIEKGLLATVVVGVNPDATH